MTPACSLWLNYSAAQGRPSSIIAQSRMAAGGCQLSDVVKTVLGQARFCLVSLLACSTNCSPAAAPRRCATTCDAPATGLNPSLARSEFLSLCRAARPAMLTLDQQRRTGAALESRQGLMAAIIL